MKDLKHLKDIVIGGTFGKTRPEKTIEEQTRDKIDMSLIKAHGQMMEENQKHLSRARQLSATIEKILLLRKIYNSRCVGFIRINQVFAHSLDIQSDFTSIEDIILDFNAYEVFLNQPAPHLGDYVYKVCENGLLTIVDSKVDSSD